MMNIYEFLYLNGGMKKYDKWGEVCCTLLVNCQETGKIVCSKHRGGGGGVKITGYGQDW